MWTAFGIMMGLLAAAAANAVLARRSKAWQTVQGEGRATGAMRVRAGASLLLWLACLVAGRWIGFLS